MIHSNHAPPTSHPQHTPYSECLPLSTKSCKRDELGPGVGRLEEEMEENAALLGEVLCLLPPLNSCDSHNLELYIEVKKLSSIIDAESSLRAREQL